MLCFVFLAAQYEGTEPLFLSVLRFRLGRIMVIFDCVTRDYLITFVLQIKGGNNGSRLDFKTMLISIKNCSLFITLHDKKKPR